MTDIPAYALTLFEMPFEVQPLDQPPPTAEELEAELRALKKERDEIAGELADGIVAMIPVVGEVKGLIEVFTHGELISGHHQSWWQKALNVASCLPLIHEAKAVAKFMGTVGHVAAHAAHKVHRVNQAFVHVPALGKAVGKSIAAEVKE